MGNTGERTSDLPDGPATPDTPDVAAAPAVPATPAAPDARAHDVVGGFSVWTWLSLQHAAVQRVATEAGVRILAIKGVVAAEDFPETALGGTDVDILVEPTCADLFLTELARQGWLRFDSQAPEVGHHAVPLRHTTWGFSLDVHTRFPGTDLPPDELFDLLWDARRQMPLGHVDCFVPSRADHAVLVMLHALRTPDRGQVEIDLLWEELGDEDHHEVVSSIRSFAATAGLTQAVDHHPGASLLSVETRVWRHLDGRDSVVAGWVAALLNAHGPRAKLAYLARLALAHPPAGERWTRRQHVAHSVTRLRKVPARLGSLARILRERDGR